MVLDRGLSAGTGRRALSVLRVSVVISTLVLVLALIGSYVFWEASLTAGQASARQIAAAAQQPVVVQRIIILTQALIEAQENGVDVAPLDGKPAHTATDDLRQAVAEARGNIAALQMQDSLAHYLVNDLAKARDRALASTEHFLEQSETIASMADQGLPLPGSDYLSVRGSFQVLSDLHMQARAFQMADDKRVAGQRTLNMLGSAMGLVLVLGTGGIILFPIMTQAGQAFQMAESASRRFKVVIESAAEGICEVDAGGAIRFINPAGADLLGITPHEAAGRPFAEVAGWTVLPDATRHSARFRHSDGGVVPVEVTFTPQDDGGVGVGIGGGVLVFHSIAEQLTREEGLRKLSHAVEHSPAAVLISNAQGLIEYVNPAFTRLSGFSADEMVGKRPSLVKSGRQASGVYDDLWETIRSGRVWRGEFCNRAKDGREYWVQSSIAPVRGLDGSITHFIGVQDDVTADRQLNKRLSEMVRISSMASEAAHIGHWRFDLKTESIFWSDEVFRVHGLPADAPQPSLNQSLEYFAPDDRGRMADALRDVVASGGSFKLEARMRAVDGIEKWVFSVGQAERDEQGHITGVVGVFQDISDRKLAEADAARNAQRLRDAVESLGNGFALFDADDRLVIFNQAYLTLYEASAEAIKVGATFGDILRYGLEHGQYPEAIGDEEAFLADRLQRHRQGHDPFVQQLPGDRWLLIDDKPTATGDHVGLRTDITDLKRTEEALERARHDAEQANRAKSEFLSNMSHELRTPLNAVLGFGQLLMGNQRDPLSDRQRDHVAQIVRGGEHLLALINDILDLAKVEAGSVFLAAENVQADSVIEDCLTIIASAAEARKVTFTVEDHAPSAVVWADTMRVRQVMLNLLSNAVKYNVEGGRVTVEIDAEQASRVRFTVKDTGIGIPQDRLEQLFQPFNRLGQENSGIEGTGIGLTLTRRLVEAMDGVISVKSVMGEGTSFTVDLPHGGAMDDAGAPKH